MTKRMHPASARQIEQLVKLHGAQAVLEAVEAAAKRFGYIQEYQQFGLLSSRRTITLSGDRDPKDRVYDPTLAGGCTDDR